MYTFFYCMLHDEGFIITGKHNYVPEGYAMQHSTNCESCDWYNMGVIDTNFKVIIGVRLNYERYGGGFTFGHYINTLTDTTGNKVENEALDTWIREIYTAGPRSEGSGPSAVFLERPPLLTVKPILVNDLTGEEEPFYDEMGTPVFYMVKHTLQKYLPNEAVFIYIDDANPEWISIANAVYSNAVGANAVGANAVGANALGETGAKYKAIIEQIYEVNTLCCPSSHIKFEIIN
jgi:hypothetical protein